MLKQRFFFWIASVISLVDAIIIVASLGFIITDLADKFVTILFEKNLLKQPKEDCGCTNCTCEK